NLGWSHSFQLSRSVPKHIGCWPAGTWCCLPVGIAPLSLLRPQAVVLLVRKSLEACQEPFGQPRPVLWIEFEGLGLDFFDAHARHSITSPPIEVCRRS